MKKNEIIFLKKNKINKKKNNIKLIAFGLNTVTSIINSNLFEIEKLIIKDEIKKKKEIMDLMKKQKIKAEFFPQEKFSKFNFDKKNQGLVAIIKKYNYFSLEKLIEKIIKKKKNKIIVLLDSIEDPHNFGAILRNLAAFGIEGIIINEKNQVPVNSTVIKVSVGGVSYVSISKVNNFNKTIDKLKENGFKIISTMCENNNSKRLELLKDIKEKEGLLCLILGNEHNGISKQLIKKSDYFIHIPVNNNMPSLNVSVASGIILHELQKK